MTFPALKQATQSLFSVSIVIPSGKPSSGIVSGPPKSMMTRSLPGKAKTTEFDLLGFNGCRI